MSCVAPGCKTGYGTVKIYPPGVGKHRFPKNQQRRDLWIKSIPRANWVPSAYSWICSLHFDENDFETESQDTNQHRQRGKLKVRRLKKSAVPTKFPGCPAYLSKVKTTERSTTSTSASVRHEKLFEKVEQQAEDFINSDKISSFEELQQKIAGEFPSSWNTVIYKSQEKIMIEDVEFNEDGNPFLKYSLVIYNTFEFALFNDNVLLPLSQVKHITDGCKITRHSDVTNIFAFLRNLAKAEQSARVVIDFCCKKLLGLSQSSKEVNDEQSLKLKFLVEQISLVLSPLNNRRYSTSFTWTATMWMKTGPALYRLLLADGLLTLPSVSYLHRLSGSYHLQTGLSPSTVSYLSERIKSLSDQQRTVSLLIDEVYTAQRADYCGGHLFGNENGTPTRTLLSFLINSTGGNYDDLVCFIPVVTLDWKTLLEHFTKVTTALSSIGFEILVVITDNHKTNRRFFVELCKGRLQVKIPHPVNAELPLFLMFDPVHVMKNFFNNFQKKRIFEIPPFQECSDYKVANFHHLVQIYEMELHMPVKLAHKLSHKVLFPGPIEKQNVQNTSAIFHDSTVEALRYYGGRSHPEFLQTAYFLSIITSWWKLVNSKSLHFAVKTRDKFREPITVENLVEKTNFLRSFVDWLTLWESTTDRNKGLSTETFEASKQASECLASVSEYLLLEKKQKYVVPIKFQNDKIESKFGKYRQMCGGNMFTSVRQFLESDRTVKMMNLAKLDLTLLDLKELFFDATQELLNETDDNSLLIYLSLDTENWIQVVPDIPESDQDALLYATGCFSRRVSKTTSCKNCNDLILCSDTIGSDKTQNKMVQDSYLSQVDRGGLTYPSELAYLSCAQAWKLYSTIMNNPKNKDLLLSPKVSSPKVFTKVLVKYLESSEETRLYFIDQACEQGHPFSKLFVVFAQKCFNIFTKNYVSELNSAIHENRKRIQKNDNKRESTILKVQKLQSEKL